MAEDLGSLTREQLIAEAERLREAAARLITADCRERRRLGLLLHDDLQQLLVAARMKTAAVRHQLSSGGAEASLAQAAELIDAAIRAARSLSQELSPPMLYEGGLAPALEWLARHLEETRGVRVEVDSSDEPEDAGVRVTLFECICDLLAVEGPRHARITVRPFDDRDIAVIIVLDNAAVGPACLERGAEPTEPALGVGERLALLGGRAEFRHPPTGGTEIMLIAPVKRSGRA